jgi:hypothetical protein
VGSETAGDPADANITHTYMPPKNSKSKSKIKFADEAKEIYRVR